MAPGENHKIETQKAILLGIIEAWYARYAESQRTQKVLHSEQPFVLGDDKFHYRAVLDLVTQNKKEICITDFKLNSNPAESLFNHVGMDMQFMFYCYIYAAVTGTKPTHIAVHAVKKPQIRQRQNESLLAFCRRLADEYRAHPDSYFFHDKQLIDWKRVQTKVDDMRSIVLSIHTQHGQTKEHEWPCNDQACYNYRHKCEYYNLCRYGPGPESLLMLRRGTRPEYENALTSKEPKIEL